MIHPIIDTNSPAQEQQHLHSINPKFICEYTHRVVSFTVPDLGRKQHSNVVLVSVRASTFT